jgi:hypothetical protein
MLGVLVATVVVVVPAAGTLVALAGEDAREGVALHVDTLRPWVNLARPSGFNESLASTGRRPTVGLSIRVFP